MYSFLIPPKPGVVDPNPVGHTSHGSAKSKPAVKARVKTKGGTNARRTQSTKR